jgi:outer membrane protein assembly factor BamA
MPGERKYYLWLLLALACCHYASAQMSGNATQLSTNSLTDSATSAGKNSQDSVSKFRVRNIIIVGNKRTRPDIILREIPFKQGDPYLLPELVQKFEDARRQLMNTSLFLRVVVALKSFDGYDVDVLVDVKEKWYIFPIPYFRPVDRNINQWIIEQKASLDRVNYGVKLLYNNVTGRNDKLRFWLINGYTKQLSFSYDRLYIDKRMQWGLNMGFNIGKNREINYNTIDNKQVFFKDDKYVRNFANGNIELTYRPAIKTRHRFGIAYVSEELSDTIIKLNPDFFQLSRTRIVYPTIYYSMSYYDLDYIPYPTKGYAVEVSLSKQGFSHTINMWQLIAKGSGNWHTGKRSFFTLSTFGIIRLPLKQPYYNQHLLGYDDAFLQGYEYYVIDGTAAAYVKAIYTHKLFGFSVNVPGGKKREAQRIPFTFYGKIYGNTGYVYNPEPGENFLINKMLYSTGIGIDLITFYDFTLKLEWSFNQLGQNGIFLHRKSIF